MPLCQYCRHLNPVGHERCAKCGRWISLDPEPPAPAPTVPAAIEPAGAPPDSAAVDATVLESPLDSQLRLVADREGKIAAIKLYREQTGVGLAEAKHAVEALLAGSRPVPGAEGDSDQALVALLRAHRKIEAVRLYSERSGLGLKESVEYVNNLSRRHGLEPATGCGAGALALAILLGAAAFLMLW